jgi:hypothetical protein
MEALARTFLGPGTADLPDSQIAEAVQQALCDALSGVPSPADQLATQAASVINRAAANVGQRCANPVVEDGAYSVIFTT